MKCQCMCHTDVDRSQCKACTDSRCEIGANQTKCKHRFSLPVVTERRAETMNYPERFCVTEIACIKCTKVVGVERDE